MVIGFDGSRAFVSTRTGTENYSYQLLKALAKIDKNNEYVIYLRPNSSGTSPEILHWPKNFSFVTINFPRLWTQLGLALHTFTDKLDVLFVPAHTLPLLCKPGLKTVVTVHDLGSEYLPDMHQFKQKLYLGFIQKYQLQTASKIIAVSKATKMDLIKKRGLDPKKIEVIYEGYDKQKFRVDILVNSLKHFNLVPKSYFLFVGTVQPRKNLERLIKAFSRQPDDYLVIVGQKGWLSDEIYNLPKKQGIEDKVKFLGYVSDEDMPAIYTGAIALTFPSLFEGFGLPILEAQACGCPVLTSNLSSMPEVAGKGAVYVNPTSVEDIIRGIREIGEIDGTRDRLVKEGFKNVKKFSWEKCARETLDVLEETCKG